MSIRRPLCVVAAALVLALGGCREEGPAEKAGPQIDEAVEEGEEAVKKMREGGE